MATDASSFRRSINGLRGLAILMVILFHYSSLSGGFTGVDVFFVISGYLITGHIVKALENNSFSIVTFYAKRARRIFPSLILVMLCAVALSWLKSSTDHFRSVGRYLTSGSLFFSNFTLFNEAGYFDVAPESKPFLHLWSLAIEEQFYIIWPLLLWFGHKVFKKTTFLIAALVLVSFALNIYESSHNTARDFYMLHTRLWELGFGGLISGLVANGLSKNVSSFLDGKIIQLLAALAISIGAFGLNGHLAFPGWHALWPVLGTGALLMASENGWLNRSIFSSGFLNFFGKISFTLYLWHWPVYSFLKMISIGEPSDLKKVMAALLSVALAYITTIKVELPILNLSVMADNSYKFVTAGSVAILVCAILGLAIDRQSISSRLNFVPLVPLVEKGLDDGCDTNADYGHSFDPITYKECERPKFPHEPVVYLIGDSHAGTMSYGIHNFLAGMPVNYISFTSEYCTPLSIHDKRPACRALNEHILHQISEQKPDLVILSAYHLMWSRDENYGEEKPYTKFMIEELKKISESGAKKVLLIGEIPTWNISLPKVINSAFLAEGLPVPEKTYSGIIRDSLEIDDSMKTEAAKEGIEYLSVKDQFCDQEGCRIRVGPNLPQDIVTFDYGHMSHAGAVYLTKKSLGPKIMQLLHQTGT